MIDTDSEVIQARIAEVARRIKDLPDSVADEVAFHMTDWFDDLRALSGFYADPKSLTDAQASKLLVHFLIHVPNHLAAASKLYIGMPVSDIFDVGATSEDSG